MAVAVDWTRARKKKPAPEKPPSPIDESPFQSLVPEAPPASDTAPVPIQDRPSVFAGPSASWAAPQAGIDWSKLLGQGAMKLLDSLAKMDIKPPEGQKDLQPGEYSLYGKAEQPTLTPQQYPLVPGGVDVMTPLPMQSELEQGLTPTRSETEGLPGGPGLGAEGALVPPEAWPTDYTPNAAFPLAEQAGAYRGALTPSPLSRQDVSPYQDLRLQGPLFQPENPPALQPSEYSLTSDVWGGGLADQADQYSLQGEAPLGFGEPQASSVGLAGQPVGGGTIMGVEAGMIKDAGAVMSGAVSLYDLGEVIAGRKDPSVLGLASDLNNLAGLYNKVVQMTGSSLPQIPTAKTLSAALGQEFANMFKRSPLAAQAAQATQTPASPYATLAPEVAAPGITEAYQQPQRMIDGPQAAPQAAMETAPPSESFMEAGNAPGYAAGLSPTAETIGRIAEAAAPGITAAYGGAVSPSGVGGTLSNVGDIASLGLSLAGQQDAAQATAFASQLASVMAGGSMSPLAALGPIAGALMGLFSHSSYTPEEINSFKLQGAVELLNTSFAQAQGVEQSLAAGVPPSIGLVALSQLGQKLTATSEMIGDVPVWEKLGAEGVRQTLLTHIQPLFEQAIRQLLTNPSPEWEAQRNSYDVRTLLGTSGTPIPLYSAITPELLNATVQDARERATTARLGPDNPDYYNRVTLDPMHPDSYVLNPYFYDLAF